MGEIQPNKCEGRELTKDQLAGAAPLPGPVRAPVQLAAGADLQRDGVRGRRERGQRDQGPEEHGHVGQFGCRLDDGQRRSGSGRRFEQASKGRQRCALFSLISQRFHDTDTNSHATAAFSPGTNWEGGAFRSLLFRSSVSTPAAVATVLLSFASRGCRRHESPGVCERRPPACTDARENPARDSPHHRLLQHLLDIGRRGSQGHWRPDSDRCQSSSSLLWNSELASQVGRSEREAALDSRSISGRTSPARRRPRRGRRWSTSTASSTTTRSTRARSGAATGSSWSRESTPPAGLGR